MRKLVLLLLTAIAFAQTPVANLKQVMRAIPLPNSNIVFDVQGKAPKDEAEWKTVENAALAVAETATLIAMRPNHFRRPLGVAAFPMPSTTGRPGVASTGRPI